MNQLSAAGSVGAPILKTIPSTGEQLSVIGLGTNGFKESIEGRLREVLLRFASSGARIIDTASAYGESEQVIGKLATGLKLRERLFLATKITAGARSGDLSQLGRCRTGRPLSAAPAGSS